MPGAIKAVVSGRTLESEVREISESLGLSVRSKLKAGRRIWGASREIDLVLTHSKTNKTLGVECKAQNSPGSAEEKLPTTISDIEAWPIPGIVVIAGSGFSKNMLGYLFSTGKVVNVEDLEDWLKLYFAL